MTCIDCETVMEETNNHRQQTGLRILHHPIKQPDTDNLTSVQGAFPIYLPSITFSSLPSHFILQKKPYSFVTQKFCRNKQTEKRIREFRGETQKG